jgi:peroxiredoxin
MQEKHNLSFPVLSDPGNLLATELGILAPARTPEIRSSYERSGLLLEELNADGTETLPMPTVVIIDNEHKMHWIGIHPDHTTRTEVAEIIAAVNALP